MYVHKGRLPTLFIFCGLCIQGDKSDFEWGGRKIQPHETYIAEVKKMSCCHVVETLSCHVEAEGEIRNANEVIYTFSE